MTFFHTPHLALGGELSTDYAGRSTVMAHATFFGWAGGAFTWWLALGFFFPTTPEYPRGILNPEPWPRYAATLSIAVVVILFASSWFTRDRIPFLPRPSADTPRFGLREFGRDLGRALTNRNYLWLLIAYVFLSLMGGLRDGLWIYTATFYWNLTSEELSWFIVGSFFGYVFSFFATSRLHGRFNKRGSIVSSALASTIVGSTPLALALIGVLLPTTPGIVPILIAFNGLSYVAISMLTISVMSALADVADENELKHGVRQEGVLYSTRALAAKLDTALGTALAGVVLTLIAFPERAEPGAVPDDVLTNLSIVYVLTAVPGLIAVYFYSQFGITRQRYEAIRAELAQRRAA
jgi:Na+/melibiose symporter-like transporter